ncbi:sigma 54-interacting transcriptional regulator [Guptibacillus algicola]|uniref:sigma 54-interacting transcriptional regulator n=1 Tax=Guptibacillus algicola TaxID=225844 RepID=UPI001CD79F0A|nr:sigma 54-interacting transcriptional regulator [Alkalihalobacillus algicola]MCA0986997.1 sigma 54-interacting transcriptional regulator [Alkalihalobacillus algicola]
MQILATDKIEQAIELFANEDVQALEVIDENGASLGLIEVEEMVRALQEDEGSTSIGHILETIAKNHHPIQEHSINQNQYTALLEDPVFNDIINSLYDGVFITNGEGIPVIVNESYERITGLKKEQVIGYHMEDLIKAGYISKSASLQVLKEKKPITLMQTISNGRKIIVSGTPIFTPDDEILYIVNSVRDITELLKLKLQIDELQDLRNLRQNSKTTLNQPDHSSIYFGETMSELFSLIKRASKTDTKILLQGETGVGKTMIAKYIHEHSKRSEGSFLELNCGAFPPNLIEAELFGYEAGAFTGALTKGKKGLLDVADNGTLFLDEIGDLPLEVQIKLLKVIEDQAFIPIGSSKLKHVDVRIIAASHKNLKKLVGEGLFREDLYYRLSVVPLEIPPLRYRREEIIPLAQHFLERFNEEYDVDHSLSIEALDMLHEYDWPGNIRELKNVIERLVVLTPHPKIQLADLPNDLLHFKSDHLNSERDEIIPLKKALEQVERDLIMRAMRKYKTTRKAAEILEVSQSTIVQKMKKWEQ